MEISPEQIHQLATLARLELTDAEVEQLVDQLPKIVNYVGQLQRVETNAEPAPIVPPAALRLDKVRPSEAAKAIVAQAPDRTGDSWKVDAVFT